MMVFTNTLTVDIIVLLIKSTRIKDVLEIELSIWVFGVYFDCGKLLLRGGVFMS